MREVSISPTKRSPTSYNRNAHRLPEDHPTRTNGTGQPSQRHNRNHQQATTNDQTSHTLA
jgi:hypothetical protein